MNRKFGLLVTENPGLTLVLVLFVSLIMTGISLSPQRFGLEKDDIQEEKDWIPDNDEAKANEKVQDNYGVGATYLQVVVRGKDGNTLGKAALVDILSVEKRIAENQKVQDVLFPYQGNISSVSSALCWMMLSQAGVPQENMSYQLMLDTLNASNQSSLDTLITAAAPKLAMFLTKDFMTNLNESGVVKAKGTMILVLFNSDRYDDIDRDMEYNPIIDADEEILEILDTSEFKGVSRMGLVELEYVNQEMAEESTAAMQELFGFVFLLIIIILFLTYRSVFDTLISLLALLFTVNWMNGIGILLGLNFSIIANAVPIMLLGLGIDYAIHLVLRYREGRTHDGEGVQGALVLTVATVGASIFLATVTTAISFGSNTVSKIGPMRDFAIFAFIGICSAFIIMTTLIPASKMLYHTRLEPWINKGLAKLLGRSTGATLSTRKDSSLLPVASQQSKIGANTPLTRVLALGAVAAEKHSKTVIAVVIVLSIACAGIATQLSTEFNFTEFLPQGAEVTEDILFVNDNFDFGIEEANVLIEGDVATLEFILALNTTQNNILNDADVNEQDPIESILTLMEDVAYGKEDQPADGNFTILYQDADTDEDGLPDQNISALFDYLRTNPGHRVNFVRVLHYDEDSQNYDGAVIRVGVNSQSGGRSEAIYDDMNRNIRPLDELYGDQKVIASGAPILTHVVITSIELTGIQSLIITVAVAALILSLVFYIKDRSAVLGLITEIPVVLVIAWVFASMYFIGMSLNVMTIMVASLTVGIGVDYAIHITHRFVEDVKEMGSIEDACRSTVIHTGTALFGAAITTIGGFGILAFAPIPPLQKFGIISSLAIGFSFISSVFVLPSFLNVWAQKKKEQDPNFFHKHKEGKGNVAEEQALDTRSKAKKRDLTGLGAELKSPTVDQALSSSANGGETKAGQEEQGEAPEDPGKQELLQS